MLSLFLPEECSSFMDVVIWVTLNRADFGPFHGANARKLEAAKKGFNILGTMARQSNGGSDKMSMGYSGLSRERPCHHVRAHNHILMNVACAGLNTRPAQRRDAFGWARLSGSFSPWLWRPTWKSFYMPSQRTACCATFALGALQRREHFRLPAAGLPRNHLNHRSSADSIFAGWLPTCVAAPCARQPTRAARGFRVGFP